MRQRAQFGIASPERFTIAYQAARDQLILATNVIPDTAIDLTGTIGRHILAALLLARRARVCPRIVKRAISKYQARGPNIDRTSYKATVGIDIIALPAPGQKTHHLTERPWG